MNHRERVLFAIIDEVTDLIKKDNFPDNPDRFISCNISLLDKRLQALMLARLSYTTEQLALYLKLSSPYRCFLPTWQPLLNEALESAARNREDLNPLYALMTKN